jgi:hypothetical protein
MQRVSESKLASQLFNFYIIWKDLEFLLDLTKVSDDESSSSLDG